MDINDASQSNNQRPYYYSYGDGNNYPPPPPPPQYETNRKKRPIWPWVLGVILLVFIGLIIWAATTHLPDDGEYYGNEDTIAVLHVSGTMSVSTERYSLDEESYDHSYLISTIEQLIYDPYNCGLLLYIDSGGGEVLAASELSEAVAQYKELTGRPVYAYGYQYAASGAYWLAATADEIWLDRYCITGSIGVTYGTMLDLSGLLEKYGIKTNTITSGAQKSMGSSLEEMTPETRAIYQSIIDEYYGYFIDWIVEQRGMDRQSLLTLADGRIYSAKQAVENGLADQVGDYESCLTALLDACGGHDIYVRHYRPQATESNLLQLLLGSAESGELAALVDLLPPSGPLAYYCE